MTTTTKWAVAAAVLLAIGLLILQIIGAMEYTAEGSLYTRASMIAVMITVAALPLFIEAALHVKARFLAGVIGVAFACLISYSLPAIIGRTGEAREVKTLAANDARMDVIRWRNELRGIEKTLLAATGDANGECTGAPAPLPESGWPKCRRKQGTVKALADSKAELECKIGRGTWVKTGGAGECRKPEETKDARVGDFGSEAVAWALAPLGKAKGIDIDATSVRKTNSIAYAAGIELAIWSLLWLAGHMVRVGANGVPVSGNPPRGGKLDETVPAISPPVETPVMAAPREETPEERDTRLVLEALAQAGRPVSNDELAGLMLVEKSEATKRRKVAEASGAVISERDGAFLVIRRAAAAVVH